MIYFEYRNISKYILPQSYDGLHVNLPGYEIFFEKLDQCLDIDGTRLLSKFSDGNLPTTEFTA